MMNRTTSVMVMGVLGLLSASVAAQPVAPERFTKLQDKIQTIIKSVTPSVVALQHAGEDLGSGVIIDAAGVILTHGHHEREVGDDVVAVLADGRKVKGKYASVVQTYLYDFSFVRLVDGGKFPAAELADSVTVRPGDWCVHVGHPWGLKEARPPVPRLGRVIEVTDLAITSSCMCVGGDSGGPLLDAHGRVIGISCFLGGQSSDRVSYHASVEVLRKPLSFPGQSEIDQKVDLLRERIRAVPVDGLGSTVSQARAATVEVKCDGNAVALGIVVDSAGLVLTKRSGLFGEITCVLAGDHVCPAKLIASSRPHDLALLQVQAVGLTAIRWGTDADMEIGQLVITAGTKRSPVAMGIVSDSRVQNIAASRGWMSCNVEAMDEGIRITGFSDRAYAHEVLRCSDVITSLDGTDVRRFADYVAFTEKRFHTAGDRVEVGFIRNGKQLHASVPYTPGLCEFDYEQKTLSHRRSGFPAIFVHDTVMPRTHCGGPLLDLTGRAVGANIARADRHETYAIPVGVVLREIEALRGSLAIKKLSEGRDNAIKIPNQQTPTGKSFTKTKRRLP